MLSKEMWQVTSTKILIYLPILHFEMCRLDAENIQLQHQSIDSTIARLIESGLPRNKGRVRLNSPGQKATHQQLDNVLQASAACY
jgi:hypothetical protein